MINNLLVPGGLGFIGSHTVIEIFQRTKANIIIVDDLSNCFTDVLQRMKLILSSKSTKQEIAQRIEVHQIDILNLQGLDDLFKIKKEQGKPIDCIMHFAAKKAIGQSMQQPLMYYDNNLGGSMNLFKVMEKYGCKNFIFSSTAGVYGDKNNCLETDDKHPLSPYGQSKMAVEMLLNSLGRVHPDWKIISLRYFNPCGGHESGLLGDEPIGFPNNLFPFIQEVILGKRTKLVVFGNDYPTPDGTCIRDYIHIHDLALAHVLAMENLQKLGKSYEVINLGSGCGYSVLEVLKGFEKALGKPVNFQIGQRRPGDVAKLIANSDKAYQKLGWKTTKTLDEMCADSCNFIFKRYKIKNNEEQKTNA